MSFAHTPLSLLDMSRQAELAYNNRHRLCAHLRAQAEHEFRNLEDAARHILATNRNPAPADQMRALYRDMVNYVRRFGSCAQP